MPLLLLLSELFMTLIKVFIVVFDHKLYCNTTSVAQTNNNYCNQSSIFNVAVLILAGGAYCVS